MPAGDRKSEIRKRAAEVFAREGFDRASIRDVAKAAEMSLAGLYYYYRSKDEILFDIQHVAFSTLLETHARALAGVTSPVEKLRCVIQSHVTFFAENIPQMKVMSRESEALVGEYAEQVSELRRRYVRLMKGILDEIGASHALNQVSLPVATFLLFGMMNWMYTWYDAARDGSAADIARCVENIFLHGLVQA